jgi:hypothetical protein
VGALGVVRFEDQSPAPGAEVLLYAADAAPVAAPFIARADEAGRFSIDVPAGAYLATASSPDGFQPRPINITIESAHSSELILTLRRGGVLVWGEVSDLVAGTISHPVVSARLEPDLPTRYQVIGDDYGRYRIRVPSGQYTLAFSADGYATAEESLVALADQRCDAKLMPAAAIRGVVVDFHGAHVGGVEVTLIPSQPFVSNQIAVTGDDGAFAFSNLAAGQYNIEAHRGEQAGAIEGVLRVEPASMRAEIVIRLRLGGVIEGRTVGPKGPIAAATVVASPFGARIGRELRSASDADGHFRFAGLTVGPHRLEAIAAGWGSPSAVVATARAGQATVVELRMEAVGHVACTVLDADNRGIEGALVQASGAVGGAFKCDTGNDGRCALDVAPGAYSLWARHPSLGVSKTVDVSVVAGGEHEQQLWLSPVFTVAGHVRGAHGEPVESAWVVANSPSAQAATQSLRDGRFQLGSLPPERIELHAAWSRDDTTNAAHGNLAVVDLSNAEGRGSVKNIELRLFSSALHIRGVLVTAQGAPVDGALVLAVRGSGAGAAADFMTPVARTLTDTSGRFDLAPLDEGSHILRALADGWPALRTAEIAAGAEQVRLVLPDAGLLRGRVVDERGAPLAHYFVTAIVTSGRGSSISQWVDAPDGRFRIAGLPSGERVRLTVADESGQTGQMRDIIVPASNGGGDEPVLVVAEGGTVVGRVVAAKGGTAVPAAWISLSGYPLLRAISDSTGAFRLSGVPRGAPVGLTVIAFAADHIYRPITKTVQLNESTFDLGTLAVEASPQ